MSLIFAFKYDGDNAEATDAGGEEAEKDVGGRDEPEGKEIDGLVAVVQLVGVLFVHVWLVDPVHPDTSYI